jgi:hypothetical protein
MRSAREVTVHRPWERSLRASAFAFKPEYFGRCMQSPYRFRMERDEARR